MSSQNMRYKGMVFNWLWHYIRISEYGQTDFDSNVHFSFWTFQEKRSYKCDTSHKETNVRINLLFYIAWNKFTLFAGLGEICDFRLFDFWI